MITKKNLTLLLCLILSIAGKAQQIEGKQAEALFPDAIVISFMNPTTAPSSIIFKEGKVKESAFFSQIRPLFHMQFADTWKKIKADRDEIGMLHSRYQQYYNGIKVEQGEYILHEKNNAIVSANGIFYNGLNLQVLPSFTESKALEFALNEVNASIYKWQIPGEEALLRKTEKNNQATYYPKGELVIAPVTIDGKKPELKLAYKFDIYAVEPVSRQFVYVDAITGKLIKKESRICDFVATGTLTTMYNGTKNMITDSVGPGSYRLRDISRGGGIETYNINHDVDYSTAVDFTDADNIWNTTANQDNAAYDAHYGAQMTYDYYLNVHNRNSYDNLGSPIRSYVHFFTNYNNAFWDGTHMSYGDGNGVLYSPLTPLDICAHELTHGVTQNSSNLVFANQSGALNESFSDIAAVCVDFFANPGGANFLIGEKCYKPLLLDSAIRYMNDPKRGSCPNTYMGTYWYTGTADNGGVHINSGVPNFWFYLLCQGGTGTNDVGFNYNVSAIGINNARLIAYRTNNFYLTSGAQFSDARTYSIMAAGDLFGPCSSQQLAVKNAWDAVNVTGVFNQLPGITATNNGPICPGTTLNLNAGGGVSYSWTGPGGFSSTASNPSISNISSGQAGVYTVVASNGAGCTTSRSTTVSLHAQPTATANSSVSVCQNDSALLFSTGTAFGVGGPPVSSFNATTFNIPDNNLTGISSPITVSNSGNASEVVSVTIDSLVHTWVEDLQFYLIAPNLSQIALAISVGGSGDNFLHTVFSSTATNVIGTTNNNTAPFTGTYAPQTPFTNLTGVANGQWKLKIVDNINGDIGKLFKWTLTLSSPNSIVSYTWSPTTGLSSALVQNPKSGITSTTTYTVTIADYRGCTASASTTLNLNPVLLNNTVTNVNCNGQSNGQINLSVSGGSSPYTYLWSNTQTTQNISALSVGVYTVTVTDATGCTKTLTSTITQPAVLASSAILTNPSCFNAVNGAVNLAVTGGTPPYSFNWSNGASVEDLTGVAAGTYNITVTDAHGCTSTNSFNLVNPPAINISASTTAVACHGGNNGAVNITVTAGSSPYSYTWSNAATTEDLISLIAGSYQVTVTDGVGCTATGTFNVSQPNPVQLSSVNSNPTCAQPAGGQIDLSVTGGTFPYSYSWSNGSTTQDLIGLTVGTFTVTVTDQHSCVSSFQTTLTGAVAFSVSHSSTNVSCNGGTNGAVNVSLTGGVAPFAFNWSDGNSSQNRSGLASGTYTATVTDAAGCSKTLIAIVSQPAVLVSTGTITNPSCFGNTNGIISLSMTGGTTPYSYLWSNGSTTADISGLGGGNFTVSVTDLNGCTNTSSFNIVAPALIIVTAVPTTVSCNGGSNGSLNLTVNGGTPPFSFIWSNGATTEDIGGLTAGGYQVTVTDINGCTVIRSFNVAQPAAISVSSVNTDPSCSQLSGGGIDLGVTGGTPPYSFNWSNGASVEDLTGLVNGTYTVTVTDFNNCVKNFQTTLSGAIAFSVITTTTEVNCYGESNGSIVLNLTGGVLPFTFIWSDGVTIQNRNGINSGTYTVTVTDGFGCTQTVNATISEPLLLSLTGLTTNPLCFEASNGSINLTVSGGVIPYTYSWSNGVSTEDINDLSAGSYMVTVTDSHGCVQSMIYQLNNPANVFVGGLATDILCNGDQTGALDISVNGGKSPYVFLWSSGSTTEDINSLSGGNYQVTVTDANGCSVISIFTVNEPDPIMVVSSNILPSCANPNGGEIDISVSGGNPGYNYLWSNGETNEDLNSLSNGTYTLTVSDQNNCSVLYQASISGAVPYTVLSTFVNVSCHGTATGAIQLVVTGGVIPFAYLWSDGNTNQNRSNLVNGTYTVTVTDGYGCVKVTSGVISEPPLISLSVVPVNPSCFNSTNGALNLTVTGGVTPYSYAWSNGSTTEDLTGLGGETYTITIVDAVGCVANNSYILTNPAQLNISGTPTAVSCFGSSNGAINTSVSGGVGFYSYSWSNGSTNVNLNGLSSGGYQVTVTDANGCTATASFIVTQPDEILLSAANSNPTCAEPAGGAIDLIVEGGTPGYGYVWSNGGTTQDMNGLINGTYTVTVTDQQGCSASFQTTLAGATAFSITASVSHVSCNGAADGGVQLTLSGGIPPFLFSWSDGNSSQNRNGLGNGTYTVTVTDAAGCSQISTSAVIQPVQLASTGTFVNPSCFGAGNGSINLSVSGGTLPYFYSWSNGSSSEDLSGLGNGVYQVTITDQNGCTTNNSFTLLAPAAISIGATSTSVSCFGGSNGALDINVSGGTAPYSYSWSNGALTEDINSLTAGGYQVTVTDANGCSMSSGFNISQPAEVSIVFTNTDPTCITPSGGQIAIAVAGGTPGYFYVWSNGASTGNLNGLSSGTYTVTVTDQNGCVSVFQTSLAGVAVFSISATVTNVSCQGSTNGFILLAVSGGTQPYSFLWSNGNTSQNRSGLSPGSYTVTITDNGGCASVQTYTITQPALLVLSTVQTDISCKGGSDGAIDLIVTGGTEPYTYLWNNGFTTEDRSNLIKATYTVTVTDANGCTRTKITILNQPATVVSANTSKTNVRCEGSQTGIVSASGTGGTPPYTYLWNTDPVSTDATVTGLKSGIYECIITDSMGCTKTVTVEITQPPALVVTTSHTNVTVNGGNNGTANASGSGGVGPYTYSWNTVPVKTTASISGLTAGTYSVKVTDSKSCFKSVKVIVTEPAPRSGYTESQMEQAGDFHLNVYPNPGNGFINVEFEDAGNENNSLSLIDYTGRLVYQNNFLTTAGLNHQVYDFSFLPKGIYMLIYRSREENKEIRIVLQ